MTAVNIMTLARVIHENNRALQFFNGEEVGPEWLNAPQEQITSTVKGLQMVALGANPRSLHESWMKDKVDAGWVLGPVKDEEKKTHPCILPYDQLPKEQQLKDVIFYTTAKQFFDLGLVIMDNRSKLVRG